MANLSTNELNDIYLSTFMSDTDQIVKYVEEVSANLIERMDELEPEIDLTNYLSKTECRVISSDLNNRLSSIENDYLSKAEGGEVSGNVAIKNSQLNLFNSNYVQTTDAENVINYSPKNSFLQAERATKYPIASTGSKGYCVIEMIMPNKLKLSSMGEPDEFSPLINHKDKLWSLAIGSTHRSQMLSIDSVDKNVVTFVENFDSELAKLSAKTTDQFISMFYTDDNALFQNEFPNEGNVVIQNFYGNHAEGGSVRAIGKYSHAEGRNTVAEGRYSHTEGSHNTSGGVASHAEGMFCFARGQRSHAECSNTSAFGHYSHTEGYYTTATGQASHVEGGNTESNGNYSHAEGQYTYADGWGSHTCGVKSHALNTHYTSFVWQGYNKASTTDIQKLSEYTSNAIGSFNINPVNGIDGFYVGNKTIAEALNVDQAKAIIEDRYTTKFEVFAISGENLPAGTRSDVQVDIDAMFDGTNEYAKTNAYDKDQIIINTTSTKKRIFKAKNNVPVGASADDNFENITSKYITEESGIQYHNYINGLAADTVQVLEIRASIATKNQNVVIYWGDGTSTKLTDAVDYTDKDNTISAVLGSNTDGSLDTIVSFKSDPTDYEGCWYCWHDYATDMKTKNVTKQKYTVTIVGSTCWGIKSAKKYTYGTNRIKLSTAKQHNIISRLWDIDLPWSESLFNTSSLVVGSDRLLYVKVPAYFPVLFSMQNMSSTFKDCKNLQYVHGFSKYTWYNTVRAVGSTFSGCSNMIKSDFRIPHSIAVYTSPLASIYSGCSSMAIDINSILPVNGFSTHSIPWSSSKDKDKNVISSPFKNCISLQCSDEESLGDILWNDTTKKWKSYNYLFSTCNSSLKSIVPNEWKNS